MIRCILFPSQGGLYTKSMVCNCQSKFTKFELYTTFTLIHFASRTDFAVLYEGMTWCVSPDFTSYNYCHTSILIDVIQVQYAASIKCIMSNMKKHDQSTASLLFSLSKAAL